MKALIRFLAWLVGGLLVLSVLLGIALKLFIDPNDYRDDISAAVADATGRTLTIEGELSLQVFPCCGIQLGPLELSNPEGFDATHFVRVENAAVSVRILPMLLRQELVVGEVELDGLDLNLVSLANGTANWEFGEPAPETTGSAPEEADDDEQAADAGIAGLDVAGISISNGRILYRDDSTGELITVSNLNLSTNAIRAGQPFMLETGLEVAGLAPETTAAMTLSATANLDLDTSTVDLSHAEVELRVVTPDVPGGTAELDIQFAALNGLGADLMTVEGLVMALRAAGLDIDVYGAGEIAGDIPTLSGEFSIQPFSPRTLLDTLGEPPMKTADPAVLKNAAVSSGWSFSGDVAELTDFKLTLDDTSAVGGIKIASIEGETIEFDLQFDALDLDRYMESEAETAADAAVTTGSAANQSASLSAGDAPLDLPVEDIRALDLNGRLGFGELKVADATLTNVDMNIDATTGVVRLHPFTADIYGGKYSDDIRLNVRDDTPRIVLNSKLKMFQVGEFLADTQDFKSLMGVADFTLKAAAKGNTENELLKNLRGDTAFELQNARYIGTDLWHEIRAAKARIKRDEVPPAPADPYTEISQFKGTAKIAKGVLKNRDFVAMIPLLQLTGSGDVDIIANRLDYQLKAQVTGNKTFEDGYSMEDLDGLQVPINISGDFEQPSVDVDLGALVKNVAERKAKEKLTKKLNKALGIDEQKSKGGKEPSDDPKEQLKEGLRGLFK